MLGDVNGDKGGDLSENASGTGGMPRPTATNGGVYGVVGGAAGICGDVTFGEELIVGGEWGGGGNAPELSRFGIFPSLLLLLLLTVPQLFSCRFLSSNNFATGA